MLRNRGEMKQLMKYSPAITLNTPIIIKKSLSLQKDQIIYKYIFIKMHERRIHVLVYFYLLINQPTEIKQTIHLNRVIIILKKQYYEYQSVFCDDAGINY